MTVELVNLIIMKNILVVYYTQTGQQKELVDGILSPLLKSDDYNIDYYKIEPINDFPFPWTDNGFYDAMPESVEGIPVPMKPFDIQAEYDLVVFAYQVWFLHPSIPFWSILQDAKMKEFLQGKKVITVMGVRNMWVNAHNRTTAYLQENNANHIGNIVFADPNSNFVSVLTVLKYLTTGIKKPYKNLPPYGIGESDMARLDVFGEYIINAFADDNWNDLQSKIVENNGVAMDFPLKTTELAASRIFKFWSSFVRKKGNAGDKSRRGRLKIYKVYLLFLIFFISPFSTLVFRIVHFIFRPLTSKGLRRIALLQKK